MSGIIGLLASIFYAKEYVKGAIEDQKIRDERSINNCDPKYGTYTDYEGRTRLASNHKIVTINKNGFGDTTIKDSKGNVVKFIPHEVIKSGEYELYTKQYPFMINGVNVLGYRYFKRKTLDMYVARIMDDNRIYFMNLSNNRIEAGLVKNGIKYYEQECNQVKKNLKKYENKYVDWGKAWTGCGKKCDVDNINDYTIIEIEEDEDSE